MLDRHDAVHPRHQNVDDHHIESRVSECLDPGAAAVGGDNLIAVMLKQCLGRDSDQLVVIDYKDAWDGSPGWLVARCAELPALSV